jgi:SnoaL-like domain
MTITTRKAFAKGTDTFNAHDIDAFAEVLADDVVFVAPGGMRGEGKAACAEFYGSWLGRYRAAVAAKNCVSCRPSSVTGASPYIHSRAIRCQLALARRWPSTASTSTPRRRPSRCSGLTSW